MARDDNQYAYIAGAATTQVHTGSGKIIGILVGETTAGSIKVIDGVSGSTTNLAELKASIAEGFYPIRAAFGAGLRIVTGGASKITVIYTTS